jgi:hypothetical protein
VPGLQELIDSCADSGPSQVIFGLEARMRSDADPFATLSAELRSIILHQLGSKDVANLRLASAAFVQLPRIYWKHLVHQEMPWVWELKDLGDKQIDWYCLWCVLLSADGGSGSDVRKREYVLQRRERHVTRARTMLEEKGIDSDKENSPWYKLFYEHYNQANKEEFGTSVVNFNFRGLARPKVTELRGLRNRRRVYGEVTEILHRVELLRMQQAAGGRRIPRTCPDCHSIHRGTYGEPYPYAFPKMTEEDAEALRLSEKGYLCSTPASVSYDDGLDESAATSSLATDSSDEEDWE